MKLFLAVDKHFIYNMNKKGYYKSSFIEEVYLYITTLLELLEQNNLLNPSCVRKAVDILKNLKEVSNYGTLEFDLKHIYFRNSLLTIDNLSFSSFSPNYFITSKVSFEK